MPSIRTSKAKFYGVQVGRGGPHVYQTWAETERAVKGFPNARHKAFPTREEALEFALRPSPRVLASSSAATPHASVVHTDPTPLKPADLSKSPVVSETVPQPEAQPQDAPPIVLGPDFQLSHEQNHILQRALEGLSFFFTGSAGTGKSILLREIIAQLRKSRRVAVTAPTGIAGLNIGGSTIHSFAGIGLGKENVDVLIKSVKANKNSRKRWSTIDTLIIDEISMVDGTLLDKLDAIARSIRRTDTPFGGIQLIISGDFYQLPPVPDTYDGMNLPITFAFEAESWRACIKEMFTLTQVFRQKDEVFIRILNEMRVGRLSDEAIRTFKSLGREVIYDDGLEPSELYPIKAEVAYANQKRLNQLPALPQERYIAHDYPGFDVRGNEISQEAATKLLNRLVAPPDITLRIGAQVMLIQNLPNLPGRLVNGSLGRVIEFMNVHAAQRNGLDIVSADSSDKDKGKRKPTPPDMVMPISAPVAQPKMIERDRAWPVVEFNSGTKLLCPPLGFSSVNVLGHMEAQRDQVPLILAWALSIHKSQGQTLERVKVNLGRVFEKGQAYVAISRATSLDSLQILNFEPTKVEAHPIVIKWSQTLKTHASTQSLPSTHMSVDHEDDGFDDKEWEAAAAAAVY